MKPDEQAQNNDALEPLQIPGEILEISAYDAFAAIADEDIEQISETWARTVPERYKYLVSAEESQARAER